MSCLFESLGRFVNKYPNELREEICAFFDTDPELIDNMRLSAIIEHQSDVKNTNLQTYTSEMRKSYVMGGAIEIMAFCKIYKTNVHVKVLSNGNVIEFVNDPSTKKYIVLKWNGGHYDPEI